MKRTTLQLARICVPIILTMILTAATVWAGTPKDMGGWQADSAYNRLYNPAEREKFKATVVRFKRVVPMSGMSPGVALVVQESKDDEPIVVHLCPEWFATKKDIGLKKGDRVKVYGAWAEIDGEDVFIGAKVKKGDFYQFKVRLTSNGKPFWLMDKEELDRERAAK